MKSANLLAAFAALALGAEAKTIALWPLEYDAINGVYDGRCAINPANDLSCANITGAVGAVTAGPGWNLPANPDGTADMLFDPVNARTLFTKSGAGYRQYLHNETVGRYMSVTNDFTLEGWMRLRSVPASGKFWILARRGHGTATGRWLLTLRHNSGASYAGVSWQIVSVGQDSGEHILSKVEGGDLDSLTNAWHHWAVSYDGSAATPTWRFYIDGAEKGSYSKAKSNTSSDSDILDLGARADADNTIDGALDYVRLSDAVLGPDEFLSAGGAGKVLPTSVVHYWKLGRTANGTIDGSPSSANTTSLSGGFLGLATNKYSVVAPSEDCAFEGNPPNSNVTLPSGNAGSFLGGARTKYATILSPDLGAELTPTNDFTVEGWAKFERRSTFACGNNHVVGTRVSSVGWIFQLNIVPTTGVTTLGVHCEDADGNLCPNSNFGTITDKLGSWHHYALSYDADGGESGFGLWTCYVDGIKLGEFAHKRAVNANTEFPRDVRFMRLSGDDHTFCGKLDCWRISKAVLANGQFMCTANGTAASNVLALWPMNVSDGVYFDGRDVVGNHHFEGTPRETARRAVAMEDTPPQAGVAENAGSVGFRGHGGNSSHLFTADPNVQNTLKNTSGFTWEGWLKRTAELEKWSIVFCNGNIGTSITELDTKGGVNFSYRSNGFVLYAPGVSDKPLAEGCYLEKDVWTHVALVFSGKSEYKWTLFLNGVEKGNVTGTGLPGCESLLIGGRPDPDNSFPGKMACVRLTRRVLTTNEFLCAQTSIPRKTFAYWPMDFSEDTLDLGNRLPQAWLANVSGAVAGSEDVASPFCPNPDTSAGFVGDASVNSGSVVLGSGAYELRVPSLGAKLDLTRPFTVEGWVKTVPASKRQTLASVWNATKRCGWRLMLDSEGFAVQAKISNPGTDAANGRFGRTVTSDVWTHVALEYDPDVRCGVWSLYLDGRAAGTVENEFRTTEIDFASYSHELLIGESSASDADSFSGGLDMWRVSQGLVGKKELLVGPHGLLILVR